MVVVIDAIADAVADAHGIRNQPDRRTHIVIQRRRRPSVAQALLAGPQFSRRVAAGVCGEESAAYDHQRGITISTIGIIALSLILGAFLVTVLGLLAWLVWLVLQFRKDIASLNLNLHSFSDDTTNLLSLHRTEIRKAFDAQGELWQKAISSLAETLTAYHKDWATTIDNFSRILEAHRTKTDEQIRKINGQELSEAVQRFSTFTKHSTEAATRIERAASAIGRFTTQWLSQDVIEDDETGVPSITAPPVAGITPEGYAAAAPGERFISTGRTAVDDAAVLAEESDDVTQR
jgi:hypothetical protein